MAKQQVLINGEWREADATGFFQAWNPKIAKPVGDEYPVSGWSDMDAALDAAQAAFAKLRRLPREQIAAFLDAFADRIEARAAEICKQAAIETALPVEPRLMSGEMPRTAGQLRQAAAAARSASWTMPTIDTATNIRSCYGAMGPVAVFGPNNFPLAFGSLSGGDFAAAMAAGNPVIGKANSMHPATTRMLAEEAQAAAEQTGMPAGTVQLLYRLSHEDGERLARDPRLAAIGYTGSRHAGLKLKAAADSVGKPIYLELSSVNPVFFLPGAIAERGEAIADEFQTSCLMGTGQFCTNPGLVVMVESESTAAFVDGLVSRFQSAGVGTLLSQSGASGLHAAVEALLDAGAELLCGGEPGGGEGFSHQNTLLKVSGSTFLNHPSALQAEAFGNASLLVIASDAEQAVELVQTFEGNLTGSIYSATGGEDDLLYDRIADELRQKVGRLINDKMPTGVAVCAAMNHGGPYPATGHPGFTAVGLPAAIVRFGMLQCFDNVRAHRLPDVLKDENPISFWRRVDGVWTQEAVESVGVA